MTTRRPRKTQIWGITLATLAHLPIRSRQCRVIVLARSRAAAQRALAAAGFDVSLGHLLNYGGTSTNTVEVAVATVEGVVYAAEDHHHDSVEDYFRVDAR
jgi:hypothetical protein